MVTECPHCNWNGTVEEEYIGVDSDCPSCKKEFVIKPKRSSVSGTQLLPVAGKDNRKVVRTETKSDLDVVKIPEKKSKTKKSLFSFFLK